MIHFSCKMLTFSIDQNIFSGVWFFMNDVTQLWIIFDPLGPPEPPLARFVVLGLILSRLKNPFCFSVIYGRPLKLNLNRLGFCHSISRTIYGHFRSTNKFTKPWKCFCFASWDLFRNVFNTFLMLFFHVVFQIELAAIGGWLLSLDGSSFFPNKIVSSKEEKE